VIIIRRAGSSDWARLRDVRLRSLAADPSAFGSSLAREQAFGDEIWQERTRTSACFLAVPDDRDGDPDGDEEVAAVGVGLIRALTEEDADGEINAMWVDPEYRGTGVGGQLLQALLETARAGRYRSVRLRVTAGNQAATLLYERAGFVPSGRTEPLLSDPQLTTAEYRLELA